MRKEDRDWRRTSWLNNERKDTIDPTKENAGRRGKVRGYSEVYEACRKIGGNDSEETDVRYHMWDIRRLNSYELTKHQPAA